MTQPILPKKFQPTSFGEIAYLETGSSDRPPVLLIHGIPTSGFLWRNVMRYLQNDFHCYAPDLMGLGDTRVDPETAEFDMEAQAEMLASFMSALGHEEFVVVCHDQGGAAAQILAARVPQRIRCMVFTDCVCYDNWPVPAIMQLQAISRVPLLPDLLNRSGAMAWLETKTRFSNFRKGVHNPSRLSDETIHEYLRPLQENRKRREAFRAFLLAGHPRYTLAAVSGLKAFHKPTMVIWAADDVYLSPSWGLRLMEDIPGAERFELVSFCGHFWQEERPAEFAGKIGAFLTDVLSREVPEEADATKSAPADEKKGALSNKKLPVVTQEVG